MNTNRGPGDMDGGTNPATAERPTVLLLVEDSLEDAEAMRRAFERCGVVPSSVIHCRTVEEVMEYLERRGPHAARADIQLPRLMILDLNMPGLDGKELLRRIKGTEAWRAMPVVVFTSSTRKVDIDECYRLGANSYMAKPQNFDDLLTLAERTKRYWFDTVLTPVIKR